MSLLQIFSPSLWLFSNSLDIFFCRAKLFNFNEVQLINSFMDHVFVVSKEALPYPRSYKFSPMLSSRSFIVSHFLFRFLFHFEWIFMKDVRSMSTLIFLHMDVQLFLHHLGKRLLLPFLIAFFFFFTVEFWQFFLYSRY